MPNYGVAQAGSIPGTPTTVAGQTAGQPGGFNVVSLVPGDSYLLFNAESPTPAQRSIAFSMGYNPGGGGTPPVLFQATWATTPTAVVTIYGSNTDVAADYISLGTINSQGGYYGDAGGFAFYCAELTSQSGGGAVTVKVKR